ncbi:glycoside hydrolase family 88 protein [Sporolactobacillus shoreicorticis]|uniref:Glycoside hydrolase family 88 protein n=1 Tax=Sporolactobacillus shoreicorticis TaxID=1923877 RepID=A0ABW5S0P6_9BACL|nr:glycoside hydrolase family 88 protein [Sporolactobacillus shoreicorticis]MCO7124666.1 glycoside hydrolase family 88 protein [Sporolactobacillus shoreicorticis]
MINQTTKTWSAEVQAKIERKIEAECERLESGIPYIPENGKYEDMGQKDIIWWTNGFWGGILWQLYHATKKTIFRETAEKVEERLDKAFDIYKGLHHDVGFMWQPTAIADYQLTGNERSLQRGLHAAALLAGRYNPRGKFIRSWNRDRAGWVIIDSMINIQTLFWAKKALGDPRFGYVAEDHADTVQKYIVREDGSVNHIGVFDPTNGELLETPGGQGYASGSSWSRGQSWAIYGFALAYLHTGKKTYLETAKKVAHYFIANVSNTGFIPLVDFRAPKEPVMWDTTAGTCAACGMLEIAKHVPDFEKDLYGDAAIRILKAIEEKYANWDDDEDGIIDYGTGSYHDEKWTHVPIIYGDYYFVEAILRLQNHDFLLW